MYLHGIVAALYGGHVCGELSQGRLGGRELSLEVGVVLLQRGVLPTQGHQLLRLLPVLPGHGAKLILKILGIGY